MKLSGGEILNELVIKLNLKSLNAFAKEIGLKRSQVLYDIENGRISGISRALSEDIINRYPQINREWLLTGEGDPVIGNVVNEPAISYISQRNNKKLNGDSDKEIDFYDVGAAAGVAKPNEIVPINKASGKLRVNELFSQSQFAIRVAGNSMTPNYPAGCIIGISIVDMPYINPGTVYVIESKSNELWIKRAFYKDDNHESGLMLLTSDNTMIEERGARLGKLCYPPITLPFEQIRNIFRVTGVYKSNILTLIENN